MRNHGHVLTPNYRFGSFGGAIDPASLASNVLALDTYDPDFLRIKTAAHFTRASNQSLEGTGLDMSLWSGFTVEGWFKLDTVSVNTGFVCKWGGSGASQDFHIWMRSSTNQAEFRVNTASGSHVIVNTTVLTTGTWYFFSATYDPSTGNMSFKINDANEITGTKPDAENFQASVQKFEIGEVSSLSTTNMDGDADQIILYDRVLTDAERTAHYNNGDGVDISANDTPNKRHAWRMNELSNTRFDSIGGVHLSDVGGVTQVNGHVPELGRMEFQRSLSCGFDAASSESLYNNDLKLNSTTCPDGFSFSVWISPDISDGTTRCYGSNYGASGSQRGWILYQFGGKLRFGVSSDGGSGGWGFIETSQSHATSGWEYVTAVYDPSDVGNELKIYHDTNTVTQGAHSGGIYASTQRFEIGSFDNQGFYDGDFDYASAWNRPLTEAEHLKMYNNGSGLRVGLWESSGFDLADCLGLWEMSEGSGQDRADYFGNYLLTDKTNGVSANFGVDNFYNRPVETWSVGCWEDRSGNDNHFVQETISARPDFDGTYVIQDGIGHFLRCINGSTPFDNDNEGCVLAVYKKDDHTDDQIFLSVGNTLSPSNFMNAQEVVDGGDSMIRHAQNLGGLFKTFGYIWEDDLTELKFGAIGSNGTNHDAYFQAANVGGENITGVPAGEWYNDITTPNNAYIGRVAYSGSAYGTGKLAALYYLNEYPDQETMDGIGAFVRKKYGQMFTPIVNDNHFGTDLEFYFRYKTPEDIATLARGQETFNMYQHGQVPPPGNDVVAIGDVRVAGVDSVTYESSFDVDADGCDTSPTNISVVGGQDAPNESGKWLKLTNTNAVVGSHTTRKNIGVNTSDRYRVSMTILYPETNGSDYGFYMGSNWIAQKWNTIPKGTPVRVSYNVPHEVASAQIIFGFTDTDGDTLVGGTLNDELYIKDFKIEKLEGYIMEAKATSSTHPEDGRGLLGEYSVNFDGVGHYVDGEDSGMRAMMKGLSGGEVILRMRDDMGATNSIFALTLGVFNDATNYFSFIVQNTDAMAIRSYDSVNGNNTLLTTNTITRGGIMDLNWSSSGAAYKMFEGFRYMRSFSSGTNDGRFPADNSWTGDYMRLFNFIDATKFDAGGLIELCIFNRQLTHDERRQWKKYRDSKIES